MHERLHAGLDQVLDDLHLLLDVDLALGRLHDAGRRRARSAASCAPRCMSRKNGWFSVFSTNATRGFAPSVVAGCAVAARSPAPAATTRIPAVTRRIGLLAPSRRRLSARRRLSVMSTSTATMITTPITTCWKNDDTFSRFSPLRSTPMISAPIERAAERALAAEQARAADDGGGDRVELVHDAGDRLRRVRAARSARPPPAALISAGHAVDHRLVAAARARPTAGSPPRCRRSRRRSGRTRVRAEHDVRDGVDGQRDEHRRGHHRRTRPVASARKPSSKPEIGPAFGQHERQRRARRSSCPSVAMNGGRRPSVTSSPLTQAAGRAHRRARAATATATGQPCCSALASTTPASATIDPTDRSMPPEMITNVMPTATIALMRGLLEHVEQVRDGEEVRREDRQQRRTSATSPASVPSCRRASTCSRRSRGHPERRLQHLLVGARRASNVGLARGRRASRGCGRSSRAPRAGPRRSSGCPRPARRAGSSGRRCRAAPPRRCRASARRRCKILGVAGQPLARARPSAGCRRSSEQRGGLRAGRLDAQVGDLPPGLRAARHRRSTTPAPCERRERAAARCCPARSARARARAACDPPAAGRCPRRWPAAARRCAPARPRTSIRARVNRIGADDRARQLGAAGADQARDAEDLAAVEREADVVQHAAPREPFDAQQLVAACRPRRARVLLGDVAVGHQPHELPTETSRRWRSVATCRPSRSTVTRWPMRNTSSRRCEM